MKFMRLKIAILLSFAVTTSYAQVAQTFTDLKAIRSFVPPIYSDTATANLGGAAKACASITTYSDGIKSWVRDRENLQWIYGGGTSNATSSYFNGTPVVTWTGTGFQYVISVPDYYINGVHFPAKTSYVTLANPNETYNRYDAFVADASNNIVAVQGTAEASPKTPPIDGLTQLYISNVLVKTGTTQPDVARNIVYAEGAEWDTIGAFNSFPAESLTWQSTTSQYSGSNSIEFSATTRRNDIKLAYDETLNTGSFKGLSFALKLKSANDLSGKFIWVILYNGNTAVYGFWQVKPGAFGAKNTTNWQPIALPMTGKAVDFTSVVFVIPSGTSGLYIDDVELQDAETVETGGGGGGSSRFGYSGEDVSATADREFNLVNNFLTIYGNNSEWDGSVLYYGHDYFAAWIGNQTTTDYGNLEIRTDLSTIGFYNSSASKSSFTEYLPDYARTRVNGPSTTSYLTQDARKLTLASDSGLSMYGGNYIVFNQSPGENMHDKPGIRLATAGQMQYQDLTGGWKSFGDLANYIEVTKSEADTKISGNELRPGVIYKITDRGDRGIYLVAVNDHELSKYGKRKMLCPAHYGTGSSGGNSWKGVWNSAKTVSTNDLVIWGGLVWKNLTGSIGSNDDDVTLDATNWVVIPKASFSNNEYVELEFDIAYDYANDWIEQQRDGAGNVLGADKQTNDNQFLFAFNPVDVSDWNITAGNGSFLFYNNRTACVSNNSNPNGIYENSGGYILANSNGGDISSNKVVFNISNNTNAGRIYGNITSTILANSNGGEISNNLVQQDISSNTNDGLIYNNQCFQMTGNSSPCSDIRDNIIPLHLNGNENDGYIKFNMCNGAIANNYMTGNIEKNRNNGGIELNGGTGNISNNVNNGNISSGTLSGNVSDTIVNK